MRNALLDQDVVQSTPRRPCHYCSPLAIQQLSVRGYGWGTSTLGHRSVDGHFRGLWTCLLKLYKDSVSPLTQPFCPRNLKPLGPHGFQRLGRAGYLWHIVCPAPTPSGGAPCCRLLGVFSPPPISALCRQNATSTAAGTWQPLGATPS